MIDKDEWMARLLEGLQSVFGGRLLFLGLQGSYRRDEQAPGSDVDAVVVLDEVRLPDLEKYRAVVAALPAPEKACGFVGGADVLRNWPRHELFQFARDTEACHGSLWDLLPTLSRDDVVDSVRIGASGLYHAVCHLYVHGDAASRAEGLRPLYKSCFFLLQAAHFLRTGDYVGTRRELLPLLAGAERRILETAMNWRDPGREGSPAEDDLFAPLLDWCGDVLVNGD